MLMGKSCLSREGPQCVIQRWLGGGYQGWSGFPLGCEHQAVIYSDLDQLSIQVITHGCKRS